jgi:hypothetical protein
MLDISRGHYAWEWTTLDTNMPLLREQYLAGQEITRGLAMITLVNRVHSD